MKSIIRKNIKLLFRSRTSTLLMILGPLIIIMLVGFSFSTTSFNLKMGVYTDAYSDLTRTYIEELKNSSFDIIQYKSEALCINGVREEKIQACIIFPPNMVINNIDTNTITFHVDQSKINLVYFVMSSLSKSFGDVSSEVSKELTGKLVTTLFTTKQGLEVADASVKDIISQNNVIITNSEAASRSLGSIDYKADSGTVNFSIDGINRDLFKLMEDTKTFTATGLQLIDEIKDIGSLTSNQTKDLNDLEDVLIDLKTSVTTKYNSSTRELAGISRNIELSLSKLTSKLKNAESTSKNVVSQLTQLKANADLLSDKAELLNEKIGGMLEDIKSIEVIDPEHIVSPITTQIVPTAESQSNLGFLFPSLIVIFIMFLGFLLPSTQIISEKSSKAFFRVYTTPKKPIHFVLATFFTSFLVISLQVLIILTVSQFYFDINLFDSVHLLFLTSFFIISLFILIGMLIGYLFNSEEMAMLTAVSIATLFLLTSGIILPLETMPSYIADKIKFNPVVSSSEAFRKSLFSDATFESLREPLGYLVALIFACLVLIALFKKLSKATVKKENVNRYMDKLVADSFTFAGRNARTLPEFIIAIQTLSDDKFSSILAENGYHNWVLRVYKDKGLAAKLEGVKDKKRILDILLDDAKRMQHR